jgi:hypothetical protein
MWHIEHFRHFVYTFTLILNARPTLSNWTLLFLSYSCKLTLVTGKESSNKLQKKSKLTIRTHPVIYQVFFMLECKRRTLYEPVHVCLSRFFSLGTREPPGLSQGVKLTQWFALPEYLPLWKLSSSVCFVPAGLSPLVCGFARSFAPCFLPLGWKPLGF